MYVNTDSKKEVQRERESEREREEGGGMCGHTCNVQPGCLHHHLDCPTLGLPTNSRGKTVQYAALQSLASPCSGSEESHATPLPTEQQKTRKNITAQNVLSLTPPPPPQRKQRETASNATIVQATLRFPLHTITAQYVHMGRQHTHTHARTHTHTHTLCQQVRVGVYLHWVLPTASGWS